jgi:hypothetical protein
MKGEVLAGRDEGVKTPDRGEWMRLLGVACNVGEFYRTSEAAPFFDEQIERLYQQWVASEMGKKGGTALT